MNDRATYRFVLSSRQCIPGVVIFLGMAMFLPSPCITQQPPAPSSSPLGVSVSGEVIDTLGNQVAGARVSLTFNDDGNSQLTTTNASGHFVFNATHNGGYSIVAEDGVEHTDFAYGDLPSASAQNFRLVLRQLAPAKNVQVPPISTKDMDFDDKPDFTISGVTDWTAVGGHGSDATLRTSESLTQQALGLQALPEVRKLSKNSQTDTREDLRETSLKASIAANPRDYRVNHELGEYYLQRARFREALPPLQVALEINQEQPDDEYQLALAFRGVGEFGEARQHLTNAMKSKDSADFQRLAGEADEKLGDPLSAVQEFRLATELSASEENYLAWGSELLLHRAVWQAIEVFQNGVKVFSLSIRLKTALGSALFSGALYEQAAQQVCEASDLAPSRAETYRIMGQIELASPSPLPCIEQRLARFAGTSPEIAESSFLYAMSLLKADPALNRTRAEELLTLASKLDPHFSDAFLQLGILAFSEHRYVESVQLLKKAVELDPKQAETHYRLAAAYGRTGKGDEAKQELHIHDEIEKARADEVEQQRRQIKQFLVTTHSPLSHPSLP